MPYSADRRDEARSCYSSSSSSSSSSRDRRRLRLLRLRWSQEQAQTGQQTHRGSELSFSAFQRRKRRQSLQSRMTKEEYLRLKHMVPAVATQPRVSKVHIEAQTWDNFIIAGSKTYLTSYAFLEKIIPGMLFFLSLCVLFHAFYDSENGPALCGIYPSITSHERTLPPPFRIYRCR